VTVAPFSLPPLSAAATSSILQSLPSQVIFTSLESVKVWSLPLSSVMVSAPLSASYLVKVPLIASSAARAAPTKPRTAMTASGNSFFMNSLLVSVHAVEAPRAAAPCRRLSDALPQERLAITWQILCLSPTGEAVVYGANGNARRQEKNEKNMAVTAP